MTLSLSVEDDRLGAYFRKTMAIADRLGKSLDFDKVMEALQRIHDGNVEQLPQTKKEKQKLAVLLRYSNIEVGPLAEAFDPNAFFQTREELYIWDSFSNRILRSAKVEEPADKVVLMSFDLACNACDREIKAELPEQHEVSLWHIAKLIEGQKDGEVGPLLNNGYANIFYCGGFAVHVNWNPGRHRTWLVNDRRLDGGGLEHGHRVFSRNYPRTS